MTTTYAESLFECRVRLYWDSTRKTWSMIDPKTRRLRAKGSVVILRDCRMVVNEKSRQRVVRTKRKTPHAFVEGRAVMYHPAGKDGVVFCYAAAHPCGKFRTADDRHTLSAAAACVFVAIDGRPHCVAYSPILEKLMTPVGADAERRSRGGKD